MALTTPADMVIMDAPTCPVCRTKAYGAARMRDCVMGKTTPHQVALDIGCTLEEVMTHMNDGHDLKVDDTGQMQSTDALLNRLMKSMNVLDEWTSFIIGTVKEAKDVDRAKVQMMVSLTQEIRKTVESVAVLQGRVGQGDAAAQINQLNTKVIDLTNSVLDNCCQDCKLKILSSMERPRPVQEAEWHLSPANSK